MKIAVLLFACAVLAASCNKETTEPVNSKITVDGLWRGNVVGQAVTLYNNPNGTAMMYVTQGGADTASAIEKAPGIYTFNGSAYSSRFITPGDTVYVEMSLQTPNRLSGLWVVNSNGIAGYAEVIRK
jgi:hypothetical protein